MMRGEALLAALFFAAIAIVSLGWTETWDLALFMAIVFYGLWRWLVVDWTLLFSVILTTLGITLLVSAYPPSHILLGLLSGLAFLGCIVWEIAAGVAAQWPHWRHALNNAVVTKVRQFFKRRG